MAIVDLGIYSPGEHYYCFECEWCHARSNEMEGGRSARDEALRQGFRYTRENYWACDQCAPKLGLVDTVEQGGA